MIALPVPSGAPDASGRVRPRGHDPRSGRRLNSPLSTAPRCSLKTTGSLFPSRSHTRAVPSPDAVRSLRPSGLNTALPTKFWCPFRRSGARFPKTFHTSAVPYVPEAAATRDPSPLKPRTPDPPGMPPQHRCPAAVRLPQAHGPIRRGRDDPRPVRQELRAHNAAELAAQHDDGEAGAIGGPYADGAVLGPRDKAAARLVEGDSPTPWRYGPAKRRDFRCRREVQTRAVLSADTVTIRAPSGLNAAPYTAPLWPRSTMGSPAILLQPSQSSKL